MSVPTFYVKQNDTLPVLEVFLKDAYGAPVNLTGSTIKFSMRVKPAGTVKVSLGTADIVAAGAGRVKYAWVAANTDTVNDYEGEFQVTFANGGVQTFPNDSFINVVVTDDVA